jgi:hypothetical protein
MGGKRALSFPFVTVSSILLSVTIIALILCIAVTVPVFRASRSVSVPSAITIIVSVAIAALLFPWGIVAGAASRGW